MEKITSFLKKNMKQDNFSTRKTKSIAKQRSDLVCANVMV